MSDEDHRQAALARAGEAVREVVEQHNLTDSTVVVLIFAHMSGTIDMTTNIVSGEMLQMLLNQCAEKASNWTPPKKETIN